jgi:oxygen-independent coproporphyrinogen-3 oxidase
MAAPSDHTEPWLTPRAAYIHVPFCAHHCGYCDFAVAAGRDHLMDLYLEALSCELATLAEPRPVQTIFIGGGTPTYLDAARLERLLAEIDRRLPHSADSEFSIEATPESLTDEKVTVLAKHGVNRVSIGAQSFHPHLLRVLERIHNPDDVPRAVECVRRAIRQVSLDLIFGVPGQTLADWDADLQRALSLQPDHLATYGLTYEKGTPLWKQRERNQVRPLDEDTELALYNRAIDTLEGAGFDHYEISNFARPGGRCRHNQVYWANEAYYGFGVGAARYVNGTRELNVRDTNLYVRRVLAGESPTVQSETLPPLERAKETIAVQLRRAEGIDRAAFRRQTGFDLDSLAGPAIAKLVDLELLADSGAHVCLTRRGKCLADSVIRELL